MNNKINPKSYTMLKYLLTLSLLGFYLVGFLSLIVGIKEKDQNLSWVIENYNLLAILDIAISSGLGILYIVLRTWMHKISGYVFSKKEKNQYLIWTSLLGVVILVSVIITVSHLLSNQAFFIIVIIGFSMMFILGIAISMLEIYSRLHEQELINQKWHFEDIESKPKEINLKKASKETQELFESKKDNPFSED
ncbi:hypothetical protein [Spiroplasma culicicola]|uniref:Transmembrane protein n=1 Tax=Spiroplasma culicicola AES-1 TaxID=1276246 RepID=W6A7M4_9MOLU|nr:hypothetical protein [Spiroplasma culicicola]AHI52860.1 hypothetical protein SCULI_v1c05190 [Spiroplasma culicicola AES-1]